MWTDHWAGQTIGGALAQAVRRYGEREAMIFDNGALTFQQLLETSGLVARSFLSLGVRRGDMVAVWMAGYAEWAYLYYGLLRIGAIIVPVNTRYKPKEVEYVLNKSRAGTLVFKEEQAGNKDYSAVLKEICPELEGSIPGAISSKGLPYLRQVIAISERNLPGCRSFSESLEGGKKVPEEKLREAEAMVQSEDVALVQFTSGTTAFPKGALLFHVGMLRGCYYSGQSLKLSEQDRIFSAQPFYHVGGSISIMLAPLVWGCTVIVQSYFEPTGALRLMEKHRCTALLGHQPHYIEYLNHPDLKHRNLCLQKGLIFASPDVNRRVHDEMGIKGLISPYGLTESHVSGTRCDIDDSLGKRLTTVGKPQPGVEMVIRSPNSKRSLPPGEPGEVCFRGWGTMKGYYDDPEKTAEAIDDEGWLHTGDLGVIDSDGYVRLIGRIKEMIRVGGENVAAADVEGFLLQHEKVKQAVVVGAPDPRLGEVCAAFVELKQNSEATEEELIHYCKAGLASFKVPRQIRFVNEWPMSGTGKIQRFLLKESLTNPGAADR